MQAALLSQDIARPIFPSISARHGHIGSCLKRAIPRRINQMMTRAMLMAALEDSDVVSDSLMVSVIADLSREEEAGRPVVGSLLPDASSGTASALITDDVALDIVARITMLEAQVAEQEATLLRIVPMAITQAHRFHPCFPGQSCPNILRYKHLQNYSRRIGDDLCRNGFIMATINVPINWDRLPQRNRGRLAAH